MLQATYIVAVNDAFTTQAWKEKLGSSNPNVHFLADDTAAVSPPSFHWSVLIGTLSLSLPKLLA